MKKALLILVACMLSIIAMAQDKKEMKLELKNGSTLTGMVTVQQDGSYILENTSGDIFYFEASEVKKATVVVASSASQLQGSDDYCGGNTVYKKGGSLRFYANNEKLSQKDFVDFQSWQQYQKAQKNRKTGNILMITGAGVIAASFALAALFPDAHIDTGNASIHVAAFSSIAGLATTITGVVFNISGNVKLKKMENAYNQNPGYVIDFGSQQYGVGFALKF